MKITGQIEFAANSLGDLREAVEEALGRIECGNTTGFDSNTGSRFSFEIEVRR